MAEHCSKIVLILHLTSILILILILLGLGILGLNLFQLENNLDSRGDSHFLRASLTN